MDLETALKIIYNGLPETAMELRNGSPGGKEDSWNYDLNLITEIAEVVLRWQSRQKKLENPYVVWYFDGSNWEQKTSEMTIEKAYREWYAFTSNGTKQKDRTEETYYFIGRFDLVLNGRHPKADEEDG